MPLEGVTKENIQKNIEAYHIWHCVLHRIKDMGVYIDNLLEATWLTSFEGVTKEDKAV